MSEPAAKNTPLVPSPLYWVAFPLVTISLRIVLRCLAPRWRVTGRQNIPARGPLLLAPNHISDLDPPVVGLSVTRPLWYMAKRELFEIRFVGRFIRFAQSFPVERDVADRAALRHAENLLCSGQALVMFPEGRLSKDGSLQELQPGATMMSLRTGVPIVPVGISGTNALMPYGKLVPRPTLHPIRVHFGEPITFEDLKDLPNRAQREQSTLRLEQALRDAIHIAQTT